MITNPLKTVYIFLGPPGSGKGTLSNLCVKNLGWSQLSTGNLCRKHIAEQTEIGKQIDLALKSGKLISDALITEMVKEWLFEIIDRVDSVILDGFPRTLPQAKAFADIIAEKLSTVRAKIVKFSIDDELVIARIGSRYVCQNKNCQTVYSLVENSKLAPKRSMICDNCNGELIRRSDDSLDTICDRLSTYHKHEQALIDYYAQTGFSVLDFNAEKSIDCLFEEFKKINGV
ncbi:adenylate kinase [Candidatus Dependentiae bacterium Noda2021]|nr:adenylate kinase [Candidatus Dependentiae bacterium Noda2021]